MLIPLPVRELKASLWSRSCQTCPVTRRLHQDDVTSVMRQVPRGSGAGATKDQLTPKSKKEKTVASS